MRTSPRLCLPLVCASALIVCLPGCGEDDGGTQDLGSHEECVGFVVTSTGKVGLSGLTDGAGHGTADGGAEHMDEHLHGTCVPISDSATAAMATTTDGAMTIAVTSRRGALSTDSPDHEGLSLVIKETSGSVVSGAKVVLKARMPHHDQTIPGGHGPKNDMLVAGLPATEASGSYVVDQIDFQMTKYWFFEVTIEQGGVTRIAYFAMAVAATGS